MATVDERVAVLESVVREAEREIDRSRDRLHKLEAAQGITELILERQKRQQEQINGIRKDMDGIRDEIASLRKTLVTFSFTVTASALGLAFAVLASTGKI
jgi:prefoldin subunit 5